MRRLLALLAWAAAVLAQAPGPAAAADADPRWSMSAQALSLRLKDSPTPVPLITDSYADAPGVNVLLGGGAVNTGAQGGLRLAVGYRIDPRLTVEMNVMQVAQASRTRSVSSTGQPGSVDLLLPYVDAASGREAVTEISYWPDFRGNAQATLHNRLASGEVNLAWALPPREAWRLDLLGGLRWLQLRESYTFGTSSPYNPPNPLDVWNTTDKFDARNRFIGLQLGLRAAYQQGPWTAGLAARLAAGTMRQRVRVRGTLETNDYTAYGPTQQFDGAYFALPSNSGEHSRSVWTLVPELALQLGYRLTPQVTLQAGFEAWYARNVARPGRQIDRRINPTQSVAYGNDPPATAIGAAQPAFRFQAADFWAQALSVGLAFQF